MAIVKVWDWWILEDYANILENKKRGEPVWSEPLSGLRRFAIPGLSWQLCLFPRGDSRAEPNYASVYVHAFFGADAQSQHVLAEGNISVVAGQARDNLTAATAPLCIYASHCPTNCCSSAFPQESLMRAARSSDGKLELKLELTIFRIEDLPKCRQTIRALFSDFAHMDVEFAIGPTVFRAHKALLAARCAAFGSADSGSLQNILSLTTADVFAAFLGAFYFRLDFLSDWQLTLGVLRLAVQFVATKLKIVCEDALSELIPKLSVAVILQILPEAIRCDAGIAKLACLRLLRERQDFLTSTEWIAFKTSQPTEVSWAICDALLQKDASVDASSSVRPRGVTLCYTWDVPGWPDCVGQDVVSSPWSLVHTAFPGLAWQLELHPRGNLQDPRHTPGFATLYIKSKHARLEVIFVNWKVTITRNGQTTFIPTPWEDILYTGAKEMKFCANAFRFEESDAPALPVNQSLQIQLEVTVEPIHEILECLGVFRSLHADPKFADVEIDVNGTIFKAHKFILAGRSSVLANKLLSHSPENTVSSITINDTSPRAFERFLSAVYFVSYFLPDSDATQDVLRLAEKYAVADLMRYCNEELMRAPLAASPLTISKAAKPTDAQLSPANFEQYIECDELVELKVAV